MNIFTQQTKNTIMAMMIGVSGLATTMADAQFKVEYAVSPEKASAPDSEETTIQESSSVNNIVVVLNDHRYEIKIVDGTVEHVTVDGKEVDTDRVGYTNNTATIFDDDGHEIYTVQIIDPPAAPDVPDPFNADDLTIHGSSDMFGNNGYSMKIMSDPPKVMVGIPLDEPSPALRKHLHLKPDQHAILVTHPIDGLPAAKAGLEDYDVIVSIDGSDQADSEVLGKALKDKEPGDTLKLTVLRGGEKLNFAVKLAPYDPEALSNSTIMSIEKDPDQSADNQVFLVNPDDTHGQMSSMEIEKLKEKLRNEFGTSSQQQQLALELEQKAREAMRDAQRQLMELRNGKLIIRSRDQLGQRLDHLQNRLDDQLGEVDPQRLRDHIDELDDRLSELEDRLDHQMDQMSEHMDRLSDMFDRLMDAVTHNQGDEQYEDQDEDQDDDD